MRHDCSKNLYLLTEDSIKPYCDELSQFLPVVTFDCRGMKPVDFSPRTGTCCQRALCVIIARFMFAACTVCYNSAVYVRCMHCLL